MEREEKKFTKYAKAVNILEKGIEKGDISKHNKVFDINRGKFIDAEKATNPINVTRDSNMFMKNGNALGRAEAEIDMLLYEAEKKTGKSSSSGKDKDKEKDKNLSMLN